MGSLLDRTTELLRRANNLQPLADKIRAVLLEGKRQQLAQGVDYRGTAFAPLKPATIRRGSSGVPLAGPRPPGRFATNYRVEVEFSLGSQLVLRAGWENLPFARYHIEGTGRMPRRDPSGFRQQDLDKCRRLLREYLNPVNSN